MNKIHLPTPNRLHPDDSKSKLERKNLFRLDLTLAEAHNFLDFIRETQSNKVTNKVYLDTVLEDLEENLYEFYMTEAFLEEFNMLFYFHCTDDMSEYKHFELLRKVWLQLEAPLRTSEDENDPLMAVPPWER